MAARALVLPLVLAALRCRLRRRRDANVSHASPAGVIGGGHRLGGSESPRGHRRPQRGGRAVPSLGQPHLSGNRRQGRHGHGAQGHGLVDGVSALVLDLEHERLDRRRREGHGRLHAADDVRCGSRRPGGAMAAGRDGGRRGGQGREHRPRSGRDDGSATAGHRCGLRRRRRRGRVRPGGARVHGQAA